MISVKTIINNGDVETGIIIEMLASGNVVNPTIYNADTRGSFGLNITLQMGDKVTINTTPGNKSVILTRYGIERNIINNITKIRNGLSLCPAKTLLHIVAKMEKNCYLLDIYVKVSLKGCNAWICT